MNPAITHNASRRPKLASLLPRCKLSTSSYEPNQTYVPALAHHEQLPANAGSRACNLLRSQALSRSSQHDEGNMCGDSYVSDDDLITAAQLGDQQAFAELCGRHSSIARRKIFRIVRNQEDTEDALQDTLLRAFTHLSSFRRSCKFSTWLTTIGVNSALMLTRKRKVRREIYGSSSSPESEAFGPREPVDRSPGPEGIYLKRQAILLLRREVKKLKPTLRSVVVHYYGSDCPLEEVANAQEISLGAAKSRLLRGRDRLRSSLSRYGISRFDD